MKPEFEIRYQYTIDDLLASVRAMVPIGTLENVRKGGSFEGAIKRAYGSLFIKCRISAKDFVWLVVDSVNRVKHTKQNVFISGVREDWWNDETLTD
jgi:hypothetical protein